MHPVDVEQGISGLIISAHCVVDAASKERAAQSLTGWQSVELSPENWIKSLERGHTIQTSIFSPLPNGEFSHKTQYWKSTRFICADGDHFRGVEKLADGTEKNPDGIPFWTGKQVLGKKFPELENRCFAVGQSVSSMSDDKKPQHRRYRLIFLFDKPIEKVEHYEQILLALAKEFPVIAEDKRSPAQPVFGNARERPFQDFQICGNVLSLDDYPYRVATETPQGASKDSIPTQTLVEWLNAHSIENAPAPEQGKYFVVCPRRESHTGGKYGRTDSYVWEDSKGWGFYCSHTSCANHRTWAAFREGNGIKKSEYKNSSRKPTVTAAEAEHDPVMPVLSPSDTQKWKKPLSFPRQRLYS